MRRSLTKPERHKMYAEQSGICGCGCEQAMDFNTAEAEHYVCVWLGNDGKPDALWRPDCHKVKTARDARERARTKRLYKRHVLGEPKRRKGRQIASRPFPERPEGMKHRWPKRKVGQ